MLFGFLLRRLIRVGTITVIDANGKQQVFGNGESPKCTLVLKTRSLNTKLAFRPSLSIGEAFMEGSLTFDEGDVYDFLEIIAQNLDSLETNPIFEVLGRVGHRLGTYIPRNKAQANVAHHYDLSDDLFRIFLDPDMQYSCAYFRASDEPLEQAQLNKKCHIAAKLYLNRPGLKILDIGSGWGGLGLYLAAEAEADVTGITLSAEQHKVSNERAAHAALNDRVRFRILDYREESGRYDRIVSVGMLEHVGRRHYKEYFHKIRELMTDSGVALVHSIGFFDPPGPINPFIRKYIFPAAEIPSLSEVCAAVERSSLLITDIEVLRLHYAETLRAWRRRFLAKWDEVARLYDETFCRMWLFYLALCEIGFRHRTMMVFQLQLAKRLDSLPLTRDYMHGWELAHTGEPKSHSAELESVR